MIFLQKATRAFTSQRDVPMPQRLPILDKFSGYLLERMQRDESSQVCGYLHEVGDYVTISMNRGKPAAQRLRKQIGASLLSELEKS